MPNSKTILKIKTEPNFITIEIYKINSIYSVYYIYDYNNNYFNEDSTTGVLTPSEKTSFNYILNTQEPTTIKNEDIKKLEKAVIELYQELTKDNIPRAKKYDYYYYINDLFEICKEMEAKSQYDEQRQLNHNYFLNKEHAIRVRDKLQESIMELWKQENTINMEE